MTALHCLLADESDTVHYVFTRAQSLTEWWQWLLLLLVCGLIVAFVAVLYLKDSVDLRPGVGWAMWFLRVAALLGVLFFFLNLERRSERRLTNNSRVLMLIDTSQSMGLKDSPAGSGTAAPRIQEMIQELKNGDLLSRLQQEHDVIVYRFDQNPKPTEVAVFPKVRPVAEGEVGQPTAEARLQQALVAARWVAWGAAALAAIGLLALLVFAFTGAARADQTSWSLLVAMVALIAAVVVFAVACLRSPEIGPLVVLGVQEPSAEQEVDESPRSLQESPAEIEWSTALFPDGIETRLGEALAFLVEQERGGPLAGILLVSDGRGNAGADYLPAMTAARDARIPIFAIGLGSDRQPVNVRLVDVDAPRRVYPGDKFTLTGYIQAFGLGTRSVKVELLSRQVKDGQEDKDAPYEYQEEQAVDLGDDGEVVMAKFEARLAEEGRWDYKIQLVVANQPQNQEDDQRVARVQVVDRRSKVLLLAGGPSREFRFLRDLLFRDDEVTSSVLLQTAVPGVSQEADELLFDFPQSNEELFEYDCIVAFDPDWLKLNDAQIDGIEQWVAEKAGGLIVVAGPVHTPQWANRRQSSVRINKLRSLYPVVLYRAGSAALSLGRFGGAEAWPLDFTREGAEAEFLWLEDDALGNEQAWASFPGVYGYYAVREPKPGAQIYARFSDPQTSVDGVLPIYMASHFYGAGRVFFQASGEMWRIREVDDSYFEQYYTKLIRWVSQGRLLRDSSQGVLIVDKERCLIGDQVGVRAILANEQHEPLEDEEVPSVLFQPNGKQMALTLRRVKDAARAGTFAGQFTALEEGDYRIELQTAGVDATTLMREVRARVPQLEVERPERNDALLKDLTDRTGGAYYIGVAAAMNRDGSSRVPLPNLVAAQDQVLFLPGTPDVEFERQLMGWLMALICGALCLEWLVRRLSKLA